MRVENIHDEWGSIIYGSYEDVMENKHKLKELGYDRDLVLFRGLGQLTKSQYHDIISWFGTPWTGQEYRYSTEKALAVDKEETRHITFFSNVSAFRLQHYQMPWHVDIPNNGEDSFPWRSLYMLSNPDPTTGLTTWANIRLDLMKPTPEEMQQYQSMQILNQSWYRPGEQIVKQPFIKVHPITGKKSLRCNYYVNPRDMQTAMAWIKETYLNDEKVDNETILEPIHKRFEERSDLLYTHQWEVNDLIIYDNWNLIHKRTYCNVKPGEERAFWRANIKHK